MVLGQLKTEKKSNEIKAIPNLMKLLNLKGSIVTIDAAGCQKKIANQIIDQEGDYVLALKKNHSNFFIEIETTLKKERQISFERIPHDFYETFEKGHGRFETRRCWAITDLERFPESKKWKGIQGIVYVESFREINGKVSREVRYFITSIKGNAKLVANAVRQHWGIENSLHWVLDVSFREDESRIRKENAPQNFSVLRHIAINLLKKETTHKRGLKAKRKKASWDRQYIFKVLMA